MNTPPGNLPKVTVMIPTYAQAHTVGRAVRSALAQDYPNLEVIVADDASPDDTSSVIDALNDARLRYVRNRVNLGRVANYRNTLNEHASGEWVVNLDGDDYFTDPAFISSAIAAASQDNEVVIVTARVRVDARGGGFVTAGAPQGLMDGRAVALKVARPEYHLMHLATLYRRAPAIGLNFYRADVISSDWESLYRLACHGKVVFLDRVVGVWNIDPSNTSQTANWRTLARNASIWPAIESELIRTGIPKDTARAAMIEASVAVGRMTASALAVSGHITPAVRFVSSMHATRWTAKARILSDPRLWASFVRGLLRRP